MKKKISVILIIALLFTSIWSNPLRISKQRHSPTKEQVSQTSAKQRFEGDIEYSANRLLIYIIGVHAVFRAYPFLTYLVMLFIVVVIEALTEPSYPDDSISFKTFFYRIMVSFPGMLEVLAFLSALFVPYFGYKHLVYSKSQQWGVSKKKIRELTDSKLIMIYGTPLLLIVLQFLSLYLYYSVVISI